MFDRIVAFSLRQRVLILFATVGLVAAGLYAATQLPVDAVPDVTNNQVQVLTQAPALSPLEVERFVTVPVELALKSLPDLVELRSLSRQGISVITVVFEDGVDTYFARQLILEQLRGIEDELPPGAETPELGPVSTGLGEVFRYTLRDTTGTYSPMELRTIQDWIVRRQLLGVPGLAEVNSIGGYLKQYQVLVDPDRLAGYGLTLREVFDATAEASGNAGAATIETGPEQLSVRTDGLVQSMDDLRQSVVATRGGTPVTLGDVAEITLGPAVRFGAATQDGEGEVVTGFALQLKGANARVVVSAVKDRIEEIQRALPEGVEIVPYYDRTALVDRTIATVGKHLAEGALLVIVVLLILLVNLRAGLVLASVIPLAMMFAFIGMWLTGQSANLMSLGAIDFGLVVDGSLIIVENILRRIGVMQEEGGRKLSKEAFRDLVYEGTLEVRKVAQFGEVIILVVYLPILFLRGIEGKLFAPMAMTVSFALIGAVILSITYVPVMCSLVFDPEKPVKHSPIITWLHKIYRPMLSRALAMRAVVVGGSAVLFAIAIASFGGLGAEFVPRLDEGDIAVQIIRLPSVSLSESVEIAADVEQRLMRFDEVETVVGNTGRAEISTDPMGVEITDAYVILKPKDEWPEVDGDPRTKPELVAAMQEAVEDIPAGVQFYQPIEMRTNELIAGARGDVVVKIFGESYDELTPLAEQVQAIVAETPGASSVSMDQTTGSPQLVVRPDRAALARYGLTVEALNRIVQTAVGGATAGEVYEGERRFDLVVRFAAGTRSSPAAVEALPVVTPTGARVPLSALASVAVDSGPVSVSREEGSRFVSVQSNVTGRDLAGFVADVQARIQSEVALPPGYIVDYGGQFENLEAATARLALVVPLSLVLIFVLLFQTFGSIRLAAIIYLCVPLSIVGGVGMLYLLGLPFSISAGVGFIALFGIAVLNGLVMVGAIRKFEIHGLPLREAVLAGADERLRAVVTTATLAGVGFTPMLIGSGAGAEVQRPLAAVVIGGLVTSTVLTLFVLPTVYAWFGSGKAPAKLPGGADVEADIDHAVDAEIDSDWAPNAPAVRDADAEAHGPDGHSHDGHAGDGHDAPEPSRRRPGAGPALGLALALLLGAGAAQAQDIPRLPTGGLTLAGALDQAEAVAPELSLGTAAVAREAARRESAGILPATEFFLGVDRVPTIDGGFGGTETSLGAAQSFRLPQYYRAQRGAADALLRQAEVEQGALRRGVRLRAALAYVEAVAADARLTLADSSVAVAESFAYASNRRQELGATGALEPLQAEVALAQAVRVQAEAAGEARRARAALATYLARTGEIALADALPEVTVADIPDLDRLAATGALDSLLTRANPRVAAAEAAVRVAEAEARAVRTERLPSFGAEAALQTEGGAVGFLGGRVGVAVPLARLANDAPDRAAQSAVEVARFERDRLVIGLAADLRQRVASLRAAVAQVALYRDRLVPQAERAYAIAIRLRREGAASYLEVLQAQTALIETRAAALDARANAARLRTAADALLNPDF
ncbi:MAG: CusA/CzcA family heavy metal efflux RND transporter [Rhodothermaceae bacterium]|nr:CusA/CzcA family heavy metal efflux RND transporter [Rhodothermaceae bacterium]